MKTIFSAALLLLAVLTACNGQTATGVQTLTPKAYADKLNATPGAQLIDVRTPEEFAGEHLDHATNIDWNGDQFDRKVATYDKSKPVFVYCKVGGRSGKAAQKLSELGFTQVYNLEGGIMKWNAEGLGEPTDKIIGMCSQEYGELLHSAPKVLVNFYADWCEPCKKMAPYMTQLGQTQRDWKVARLNADEHKTLVREMKLDTLPVVLLYQNGQLVWQHQGFLSEAELKQHL